LLEGGRNLLLESAQEATLTSVPTQATQGQSNPMVRKACVPRFKLKFTRVPIDSANGCDFNSSIRKPRAPGSRLRNLGIEEARTQRSLNLALRNSR